MLDVNVLVIFPVKNHLGNRYVSSVVEEGFRGAYVPLVMDVVTVRAFWIMTRR